MNAFGGDCKSLGYLLTKDHFQLEKRLQLGKYRDTVRDYWRGEASAAELAPRLTASGDVFNDSGRRAWASVNFITAHDGFTLNDLVSYNDKHNEANGEDQQRRPLPQPLLELRA